MSLRTSNIDVRAKPLLARPLSAHSVSSITASKSAPRSGEAAPPHESRYHQLRRTSWAARMAARALAAAVGALLAAAAFALLAAMPTKKTEEV